MEVHFIMPKPTAKIGSGICYTAAVANHTTRAQVGSDITVPTGGVLDYIEVQVFTTLATTVYGGGLVEIENNSIDWKPFNFYTQRQELLGTGGSRIKPMRLYVTKPIPKGSKIRAYYTASNAATGYLIIMFHWKIGATTTRQTYMDACVGTAGAGTLNTWQAAIKTLTIPAGKGGRAVLALAIPHGAIEDVETAGGAVRLTNDSADWVPTIFITEGLTGLTTIAGELHPNGMILDHPLLGNSVVTMDFMPIDDQSQTIALTLVWEG